MICIEFSTGPHKERLQKGGGPGGGVEYYVTLTNILKWGTGFCLAIC